MFTYQRPPKYVLKIVKRATESESDLGEKKNWRGKIDKICIKLSWYQTLGTERNLDRLYLMRNIIHRALPGLGTRILSWLSNFIQKLLKFFCKKLRTVRRFLREKQLCLPSKLENYPVIISPQICDARK